MFSANPPKQLEMMGKFGSVSLALLIAATTMRTAFAQDSHFWNHQYGARSTLLGGAVIAGVNDASATFYNPGALAINDDDDVFEGTRIFEFTNITIHSEANETLALDDDNLGRAPSFLGGFIPTHWKRHRLAYAIFKRQDFDLRANVAIEEKLDVVARSEGDETVFARARIDNKLGEQWVGLGWSYAVTPEFGLGITTFVARRSQRARQEVATEAVLDNFEVVSSRVSDYYKYNHYRLLWKLGASVRSDLGTFGLTFTSPSFAITGTGEREIVDTYTGLDTNGDGSVEYFLGNYYEDGLGTNYKMPTSVGVGYSLKLDGRVIHTSAEWFKSIPDYNVVYVSEARGQTDDKPISNRVNGETGSVLNFALGLEQYIGDGFTGFASFATDYSTFVESAEATNLAISTWDLYHLTTGTRFTYRKLDLTFGLGYVFGSEDAIRNAPLIDIDETNRLFGVPAESDLQYQRFQLVVGLSVGG